METLLKIGVASIFILNIAAGIAVICQMVSRLADQQPHIQLSSSSQNMKEDIDKAYTECQRKLPDRNTKKNNDVGREHIASHLYSQLKPVAFYSGLNITDLGKEHPYKLTPARGWAAQTMVGPERQVLYNGMQYENGSIIVPAAGVYVVYSHVTFNTEAYRHDDKETDFYHLIVHYNAETQEENIALKNVVNENSYGMRFIDGDGLLSSDIHGILELNAGDQLRVDLSGVSKLSSVTDWFYFGVYMI
ncbi:lymphotoxin-alpha-like [Haliotis cracherodii]|uniref:lymphotoxin-alpha-like n=1 Tax=Haliotis cracherodii TaxID=6455 RepID=UPI0039E81B9D